MKKMKLGVVGIFLLAVLTTGFAETAGADPRLEYPIEWSGVTGYFNGTPSVKMLYESGCLKDETNENGTIKGEKNE